MAESREEILVGCSIQTRTPLGFYVIIRDIDIGFRCGLS
jgi:hypothetical protein